MQVIQRDIVGAFIFSADNKILLGYNKKGGVYEHQLVVPGGGIEDGEGLAEAVCREVLEETGIDLSHNANVSLIEGVSTGSSEKTDQSGNKVLVEMKFNDFEVKLAQKARDIQLIFDDDYASADWFASEDLVGRSIGPATQATLKKLGFLE